MEGEPQTKKVRTESELVASKDILPTQEHGLSVTTEDIDARKSDQSDAVTANKTQDDEQAIKVKRPPRSERKRLRAEAIKMSRKLNRKQKKMERKERIKEQREVEGDNTRQQKLNQKVVREHLEEAQRTGQVICVDCSLEHLMSAKEVGKLASQIGRMYGANRRADTPVHLYLTGLKPGGLLHDELNKKMTGFDTSSCIIDRSEKVHTELFPLDKVVYLSPDSSNPLTVIDPGKVYIMGGLVDESIQKNVTHSRAETNKLVTARLPIDEHMVKADSCTYSKVLAVCQVFDILLKYMETKDWKKSLSVGVPRRKGYIVNTEDPT